VSTEAAKIRDDRDVNPLVALAFCVGVFVFVWRWVDPRLLYYGDMATITTDWWISFPTFFLGWDFFREHALQPGGLVSYGAKLLMQYYYYTGAGALILAALAGALIWGTNALGAAIGTSARRVWAFVPSLVLLGVVSSYLLHVDAFLAVLVALASIAAYGRLAVTGDSARLSAAVFVVLSVPLFWVLGGTYLLFAAGCGIVEWRRRRRRLLPLLYGLYGVGLFCGGTYLHRMRQPDEGFHVSWNNLASAAFWAAVPAMCGLILIGAMLAWDVVARRKARTAPTVADDREQIRRAVAGIAVLIGISVLTSFGLLDQETRTLLRANYLARMNQWSELLDLVREYPPAAYSPGLLYDINRALFETGQFGDRMFEFPQDPKYLIQVGGDAVPHRGCYALLLRLGCVNEAERTAYEALEVRGPRPYVLRDLAIINIVKDRPDAARVFLRLLARDVIHGGWARQCLQRLAEDARLEWDPEVSEIRQRMLREDHVVESNRELLTVLLQQNPRNRAAFEYLMAYYLQTCQLEEVVKQIPKLRDAGFDRLPTSYGEAVLLYCQLTGQAPDLGGWTVSTESLDRFRTFMALTQGARQDQAALSQVTAGSYFPYFATRQIYARETSTP
jgi:hypothetical protein